MGLEECNHFLGFVDSDSFDYDTDYWDMLTLLMWLDSKDKIKRFLENGRLFTYCPNCGIKIDWEQIKGMLNGR